MDYCYCNKWYLPTASNDCLKHANLCVYVQAHTWVCTQTIIVVKYQWHHMNGHVQLVITDIKNVWKRKLPQTQTSYVHTTVNSDTNLSWAHHSEQWHKPYLCTSQWRVTQISYCTSQQAITQTSRANCIELQHKLHMCTSQWRATKTSPVQTAVNCDTNLTCAQHNGHNHQQVSNAGCQQVGQNICIRQTEKCEFAQHQCVDSHYIIWDNQVSPLSSMVASSKLCLFFHSSKLHGSPSTPCVY